MTRRDTHITDHAILRYLKRVKGVDVGAARKDIARIVQIAPDHEGASGIVFEGFVYKLRDGSVCTVVPRHRPDIHTGRKRK